MSEPTPGRSPSPLDLVCGVASDWAGEYGFVDPQRATAVYEAVYGLAPHVLPREVREHFAAMTTPASTP